jgi:hypothetical protein
MRTPSVPPLLDPAILAQYRSALANWRVTGYVDWNEVAEIWVQEQLRGLDPRRIGKMMYDHVRAGHHRSGARDKTGME